MSFFINCQSRIQAIEVLAQSLVTGILADIGNQVFLQIVVINVILFNSEFIINVNLQF